MSTEAALPPRSSVPAYDPRDLEYLTVLLDVSGIYLTPEPGTGFTLEELMREVRGLGGDDVDERDVAIVLGTHAGFKTLPGRRWRLR